MQSEHWKQEPDDHDFPAALTYLSLLCDAELAAATVQRLREASTATYEAKDLLRSSRLALLKKNNVHVIGDLAKIKRGERLSPVLLVRGIALEDLPLTVADGYHRICSSYYIDENAQIPCRIVEWPR